MQQSSHLTFCVLCFVLKRVMKKRNFLVPYFWCSYFGALSKDKRDSWLVLQEKRHLSALFDPVHSVDTMDLLKDCNTNDWY